MNEAKKSPARFMSEPQIPPRFARPPLEKGAGNIFPPFSKGGEGELPSNHEPRATNHE